MNLGSKGKKRVVLPSRPEPRAWNDPLFTLLDQTDPGKSSSLKPRSDTSPLWAPKSVINKSTSFGYFQEEYQFIRLISDFLERLAHARLHLWFSQVNIT
uniref:Uncharacterized protein n=1 Tax=Neogobius melanostomus TaxID=47308 RepID=A0A8C6THN6_9GOBI